jgi:hypothetical protein
MSGGIDSPVAAWRLMRSNPVCESGPNRQPRRAEVEPFTLAEVDRIAVELGSRYGPLVVFAAETALRPAEWLALEWRDVQPAQGAVVVERTLGPQGTKPFGKTDASRRSVPLSRRALAALDGIPRRTESRLVFAAQSGLHLDLKSAGVAVTCIHPGFVKSEMTAKNKFPMPFLLGTDDAADRMGRAILRREKRFAYPWPMVLATRAARLVPDAVIARVQLLLRSLRRRL